MEKNNDLTIKIYSTGTTPIYDSANELARADSIWFETQNKGGLYGAAGCFVPRYTRDWWEIKGSNRLVIKSGQLTIYEGKIVGLPDVISDDVEGVQIDALGFFGDRVMRQTWRKVWCDDRVDDQTWEYRITATAADKCTVSREQRIKFLPKAEAWADGEFAAVRYDMSFDSIARLTYDYDLQEGGQAWELSLWSSPDGSTFTQMAAGGAGESYNTGGGGDSTTVVSSSGTGSVDVEPASGTTHIAIRYYSRAAQTPTSDGTYYAFVSSLKVYSEDEGANGIRLYSVCEDAIADTGIFNASTAYLTAMSSAKTVEPFMTSGGLHEYVADTLMNVCQFGDGDNDPWTVGVLASDKAAAPDGKPVLYTAEIPDPAAGHEYFLRLDDDRVVGGVELTRDYLDELFNYIIVQRRDERGWVQTITPTEQATLTDATSTAAYGRIDYVMSLGNSSAADALARGVRFLAQHKDPKWVVNGTLEVAGSIDGVSGEQIPVSQVNAYQKRIKIDGYDTFVVTRTRYDAETNSVSIYLGGVVDVTFADTIFSIQWDDSIRGGASAGTGGGKPGRQPWWKILDEIGPRGRQKLKDAGKWEEYKREGMKRYRELRKQRGKG